MTGQNERHAPIRLGLMAPLSGLVELYGPEISWAGQIATDQINARGGILGRPLELIIKDDGSQPESALPAAMHLVDEDNCVAIIGNLLSNSRIAVANQVATPRKIPYLNFSFYEGSIHSRYFFHFAALPNQQIDKMIPYMAHHYGPKFFFAGSNYEWPRGSIDAAKNSLLKAGGEIVGEEYLPFGSTDFSVMLDRLKKSGADVFVPYFAGKDQLNLLNQFYDHGLKEQMQVVMGHYDEMLVSQLPAQVRAGFFSSNTYFMSVNTEENHRYLECLAKRDDIKGLVPHGNGVLTNFGEGTYVCVKAFAQAAETAGTLDTEPLIEALEQVSVDAPQGHVTMDRTSHHAKVNSYLAQCNEDGTFDIIEDFGPIDPEIPERYSPLSLASQTQQPTQKQQQPSNPILVTKSPTQSKLDPISTSTNMLEINTAIKILEKADISILAINSDGIIIQANDATSRIFGYQHRELAGLPLNELLPPRFRSRHQQHIHDFLQAPEMEREMGARASIAGYRKDGSEFPASATISKFYGPDGWVMVATLRDITQQKEAEEKLTWQATHDPLTDLPNRKLIQDRLHNALKRSARHGRPVALLFLDLDNFKLINDSYGHNMGDRVLIKVAQQLIGCARPGDTVARFGGDEFIILCEQLESETTVTEVAENVLETLKQPFWLDGQRLYVTASIGATIEDGEYQSADSLIQNADTAMYAAKELGRNRWQLFNNELRLKTIQQLDITNGLCTAINQQELYPRFQPIVNAANQEIIGAELLLRWCHQGKEISPGLFIPAAESSGAIMAIGEWVFEQACRALAEWERALPLPADFYLSVNVSARQLCEPDLVERFARILTQQGATASRMVLEVTETALMTDIHLTHQVLTGLSKIGLKVAIDDFGTGYSSLGKLIHLPVDKLKVDRVFVDALGKQQDSLAVASAIIHMAHALGLQVIAEGVETMQQLQILGKIGCDHIQGYYFYTPLLKEEFELELQELILSAPESNMSTSSRYSH